MGDVPVQVKVLGGLRLFRLNLIGVVRIAPATKALAELYAVVRTN